MKKNNVKPISPEPSAAQLSAIAAKKKAEEDQKSADFCVKEVEAALQKYGCVINGTMIYQDGMDRPIFQYKIMKKK